jgi:hypothetical protein
MKQIYITHFILGTNSYMFRHQAAILSCERVAEDAHYCMVALLQKYGLCWLTCVIENFNSLKFLIFAMKVWATGT